MGVGGSLGQRGEVLHGGGRVPGPAGRSITWGWEGPWASVAKYYMGVGGSLGQRGEVLHGCGRGVPGPALRNDFLLAPLAVNIRQIGQCAINTLEIV